MSGGPPHVMIVDDHAVLAQALAGAFESEGFRTTAIPGPALQRDFILDRARDDTPDVVLLDLMLGSGLSGVDLVRPLRDLGTRVLVMTSSQDQLLLARCLDEGAEGLFDKSQPLDQLVAYVADAAQGYTVLSASTREELRAALRREVSQRSAAVAVFATLTERESQVLRHLVAGRASDEIAAQQSVALSTVRSQVKSIFRKLGVNSRLAAVTLAREAGWPAS